MEEITRKKLRKNKNIYDETENIKKRAITIFYKSR